MNQATAASMGFELEVARERKYESQPDGLEALVGGRPVEARAGRDQAVFEGQAPLDLLASQASSSFVWPGAHPLNKASIEARTRSEAARSCVSSAQVLRARSRSRGK